MDIFHVLTMLGGLCLFLFGMNFMGQSLERRAGGKLRTLLDKMTGSVGAGFLTGLGITAIIQSSSATTVMVVGFVNSGLMNLRQAINVIMGANVGTTVTAWLLSLAGIDGGSTWVQLLKPTSFTPVLALIGIIFYMFCKDSRKKDTGAILLGFATLMFGMDTMSGAVAGLKDVPGFAELFLAFTNPLLGVLVGAVLTAIIQSSSASVGILQALASTGQVSYAAAVPIIMGQNIGTCVTALISCVGTNKNAKRAAVVHLMFNVIGVAVLLTVFDSHTAGLGWRYICDFGWMMAIAALVPMLYLMHPGGDAIVAGAPDPSERNEPRRDVTKRHPMMLACVRGLVVAALMASIILAVLACFIPGRDDSLINNNPVLYDTVVAWFRL